MSDKIPHPSESHSRSDNDSSMPAVHYIPFERLEEFLKPDHFTIDFQQLFRTVWIRKSRLLISIAVFATLGLFIAVFSTVQYQSYALLIPEIGSAPQSRTEQLLQRYGSELGIGNMMGVQEGVIPPMLFSTIVMSTPFQVELRDTELSFRNINGKITYVDYVENYASASPVDLLKRYTVGLPRVLIVAVKNIFTSNDEDLELGYPWLAGGSTETNVRIVRLSKNEMDIIDGLRSRIMIEQNIENGLIYSAVTMPDPIAAAELNYAVVELLKEYITDYQLQKVREDLEFTERMKEESEKRFNEAQFALASFLDQNKVLSTSRARVELERLQDEKNLAFGIYNTVSQRLEQTKLQLNEQRPTFKEVQPVTVPTKHSSPKRVKLMAVSVIIGTITGLIWIFFGENLLKFIKAMQKV